MIWIWLGVVIALVLIEFMSRNMAALCFALSGFISYILTLYTKNYVIQLSEFLFVGSFLIIFVRPKVIGYYLKLVKEIEKKISKIKKRRKLTFNNKKKEKKM